MVGAEGGVVEEAEGTVVGDVLEGEVVEGEVALAVSCENAAESELEPEEPEEPEGGKR